MIRQTLRPMVDADLERVLMWRNHPEVRRYMYTQHEITLEEHARWFAKASRDSARHLLVFECDDTPLGFVSIHETGRGGVADWGFYASADAPQGTGRLLGQAALRYAFGEAKLHKLCGQVLDYNVRSIRFHERLGFSQEGVLRQQHYDGQRYHDVICLGLLLSEWQAV
ncbi:MULTISPECIES: UDP-4-amino-4,6-dideoxy-N-acetyl-beta-L-altrosamine N-acetyltransferase [Pseudomonas]|uniref:UDP-4-amino-4, 6-dideoxy-N-acetyl-beta-L-altrosamine N-acetyltransferase n=1 Tax=Pseudomonas TaxID=286 RepID=UPI001E40DA86|nr:MULTISPECIES: UDP-4-amino-4,6-dideoxy-N-acetyl-beta-L-altrosamine N-acetyltransferase [Pseudomonas]MCE1115137.1 UDP-4-amino-4,6-dideoxy-N-acetyl-beta-L-altrosamine N-acetyltransferase [Pseudomonas sp. NMI795_08]